MSAEPGRRSALGWLTSALGAGIAMLYAVPAAIYLRGRVRAPAETDAADLGPLDALPEGVPHRVSITTRGTDAWSDGGGKSGAVFLLRRGARVTALDSTCPHTGCAVEWSAEETQFRCPCHKSAFSVEGERVAGPAPRGLDPEEVEIKDGRVLCRYTRYRSGRPDRTPT